MKNRPDRRIRGLNADRLHRGQNTMRNSLYAEYSAEYESPDDLGE